MAPALTGSLFSVRLQVALARVADRCARFSRWVFLLAATLMLGLPVAASGTGIDGQSWKLQGDWVLQYDVEYPEFLTAKELCTQGIGGSGRGDARLELLLATGSADLSASDGSIGCEIFVSAAGEASRSLAFRWMGSSEEVPQTTAALRSKLGASATANFQDSETHWGMAWALQIRCNEMQFVHTHAVEGNWSPGNSSSIGLSATLGRVLGSVGVSLQGTIPTTVGSSPQIVMMHNTNSGSKSGLSTCGINLTQACGATATADGGLTGVSSVNGNGISRIEFELVLAGP